MVRVAVPPSATVHGVDARWAVLTVVSSSLFLSIANGTSLNVALPSLQQDLGTTFAHVQWVQLAFLLATLGFLPLAGSLGDSFDKRSLFSAGLVLFGAGSFLCGGSGSLAGLVAARFLQGIGVAVIQGLAYAVVAEVFPDKERGRAIGLASGFSTLAIVCGPVFGGAVLSYLNWRWIFFLTAPAACLLAAGAFRVLPPSRGSRQLHFDAAGALTLFGGLGALLVALTRAGKGGFFHVTNLALLALAALLLGLFARSELKARHPLVDPGLVRRRPVFTGLAAEFAVFASMHSFFFLFPFLLKNGVGLSPFVMGLILATNPAVQALVSPLSGALSDRYGSFPLTSTGLLFLLLGVASMRSVAADTEPVAIALRLVPFGIGAGLFVPANAAAVLAAAPRSQIAATSSALALSRRLAQAVGVASLTALWTSRLPAVPASAAVEVPVIPTPEVQFDGFADVLLVLQLLVLAGLAIVFFGRARRPPRELAATPDGESHE